jgi:hypothetical protein
MLEFILARTKASILITRVEEEKRRTPLYVEMGTRALVLGGHPYTGYIVSGTVGFLSVKVRTREKFEIGESLPFSKLWEKRDPARDFSMG